MPVVGAINRNLCLFRLARASRRRDWIILSNYLNGNTQASYSGQARTQLGTLSIGAQFSSWCLVGMSHGEVVCPLSLLFE
jgi:hypothetical protein